MRCIMCHLIGQASNGNNITQSKKNIFSYNPKHGTILNIINLKKHVMNEHKITLVWYKK
jgi:hypothetical protein